MERPKPLGIALLGFTFFALYLGLANFLWFIDFVSLPLGSAVNPFIMSILIADVAILNLYVVYVRRQPRTK